VLTVSRPSQRSPAAALSWLDAERATLVAVTVHAAAEGWPRHATRLATTLFRYLDNGGHYTDAITIHTHARQAAHHTGDRTPEAHILVSLGGAHFRQGDFERAADNFRQALALARESGDRLGEARALNNLGIVDGHQGRYPQAAGQFQQALTIYREIGDRPGEARVLENLGGLDGRHGRHEHSTQAFDLALAIYREIGDRSGEARTWDNLGSGYYRQRRHDQAAASTCSTAPSRSAKSARRSAHTSREELR
jgi:tetratricopeptide (TPR) repeat protein